MPSAGGAEKQFFLVTDYLNTCVPESAFVVGARLPRQKSREVVGRTRTRRLTAIPLVRTLRQAIALPCYLLLLAAWLVRHRSRYDAILVGAYDVSLVAVGFACRIARRPFVVRYASLEDFSKLKATVAGRLGAGWLFRASKFVVNSELAGEHLRSTLGIGVDQVAFIRNGVDIPHLPKERARTREAFDIAPDQLVLLNVSSFYPGKNQEALIRAWPRLRMHGKATLLLVGAGPTLANCRQLVDPQWSDEIRFLGHRGDVTGLLGAADVFLFPSSYPEGLANALLEAMAAALPCVVNRIAQNLALIEDGVNGVLFDIGEPGALDRAVTKVLLLPDRGQSLGIEARATVARSYSPEACGLAHSRLLQALARAGKSAP